MFLLSPTITNTEARGKLYGNMQTHNEKSVLGQDDFLKILIVQLQNQDPMQPMQDRDFIAQMATFSSLEQMTNMSKAMQEMRGMMLGQATSYIGKEINYEINVYDASTGSFLGKDLLSGFVTGIESEQGKTILVTSNGHRVTLDSIRSVAADFRNPITENAHLIGKKVSYALLKSDGSIENRSSIVTAVSYLEGKVQLVLDNDDKIGLSEVLKVENA